jgi:hypothetical protein
MKQNLSRFLFGMFLAPTFMLLHECGHYASAAALGFRVRFHFAEIQLSQPATFSILQLQLITAAGPAVEATLAIGGLLWLWHLRRNRLQSPATLADWLATFPIFCSLRWMRCFGGSLANPVPSDEAHLSDSFGFPPWLLAYLLAPVGLALFIVAIRLHPRGSRLFPFVSAFLGLVLGTFLWLRVIGPRILP